MHLTALSDCPAWWQILSNVQGDQIFDVGANGGMTAALFSRNFRSVIAFEPAKESFGHLNEVAMGIENVQAVEMAISNHEGMVELHVNENSIKTGQLTSGAGSDWGDIIEERSVICSTLDAMSELFGRPSHVKIDVEGHEDRVMEGAEKLVKDCRTTWLIEAHSAALRMGMLEMLDSAGHRVETHRHTGYREGSIGWIQHSYLLAHPSN